MFSVLNSHCLLIVNLTICMYLGHRLTQIYYFFAVHFGHFFQPQMYKLVKTFILLFSIQGIIFFFII